MVDRRSQVEVYLRDHHAGSTGGRALARRVLRQNRGTLYEPGLRSLVQEIEDELADLRSVMRAAAVSPARVKLVLALSGERLARLKPNGAVAAYSPLARVLELEALSSAVTGKLRLWTAVRRLLDEGGLRPGVDLDRLDAMARAQLEMLEELHAHASGEAFSVPDGSGTAV